MSQNYETHPRDTHNAVRCTQRLDTVGAYHIVFLYTRNVILDDVTNPINKQLS